MNRFQAKSFFLRWILPFFIFGLVFFMIGFSKEYYAPRLESWLVVKIEELTKKYTPLRVFPDKLQLDFLPPRVTMRNVRVIPQKELKSALAPFAIKKVQVDLSLLSLLRGALRVGEISFSGAEISYISKSKIKDSAKPADLTILYNTLIDMPIDLVTVDRVNVFVQDQESNIGLNLNKVDLRFENSFQALILDLKTPSLRLKKLSDEPIVELSIETKVLLRETRLQVSAFKAKKNDSFVVASGSLYGDIPKLTFTDYSFRTRTHVEVDGLKKIFKELGFQANWPALTGIVNLDLSAEKSKGQRPEMKYRLETQNFTIAPFEIGRISTKGDISNSEIELEDLSLENSAGKIKIKNLRLISDWFKAVDSQELPPITYKGKIQSESLELRKLLRSLGIGDTPLNLLMFADLDCEGSLFPQLNNTCRGSITGKDFAVWSNRENGSRSYIAEVNEFKVSGETNINADRVTYQANIHALDTVGKSDGVIKYDEGFKINFDGGIKDFAKTVKNLANLKLEGEVGVRGSTEGNSHTAFFEMDFNGKNVWFQDYGLGQLNGRLKYKNGTLTFPRIEGSFKDNLYDASVAVNLLKEKIIFEGQSARFETQDAIELFARKIKLPFVSTGIGKVSVKGQGPLKFNRLSYDLNLSVSQGTCFSEPFDSFRFHVNSNQGLVTTKLVQLKRGKGTATLNGRVDQEGIIDAQASGEGWSLDGFENLKALGLNLNGNLNFNLGLSDYILDPGLSFSGAVKDTTLNDTPMGESRISLTTKKKSLNGEVQVFGGQLFSLFSIPFNGNDSYSIFVRSKKFDFTKFFSTISSFALDKGFDGNLDAELRVSAREDFAHSAKGFLRVDNLTLRRGTLNLKNSKPMQIQIENGILRPENFNLAGEAGFIKVTPGSDQSGSPDLDVNGQIDLRILNLAVPFLEDLRGNLSVASKINGSLGKFNVRGSSYINNGFVRVKDFPHHFDRIKADFVFSDDSLIINSISSRFANGNINASGKLTFESLKRVPVKIDGQFTGIEVEVPRGFKTEGSGQVSLRGDHFPYTFGLNYGISKATVNRNLSDGSSSETVRPSAYLPRNLNPETFTPFLFDLAMDLEKPASVQLSVNNIEIQTTARGAVKMKGPLEDLRLTGRLTAGNQGQIAFRNNIFDLNSGWVDYNNSPPSLPKVYFSANTRISNSYDVNLLVQGIANNPNIELTSSPALPEHEIISLLALGITSRELDQNVRSEDQAAKTSLEIGSALIRDQLGLNRNVEDKFGVQVDISSSFDEDSRESVPAVTIRKNFTPKFGLSGTRTLGDKQTNKLKAEMKLNKNLSVVGQFENQNIEKRQSQRDSEKVGLDFEYRFEFK